MDLDKKVKITTPKQFSRMVELLEQNPTLGRGYSSGVHKINAKQEWNKMSAQLNVLGPPTRTGDGWMKVWADYKLKIKKKLVHNKSECNAPGGGSFKQYVLSPTEEAAANLLKMSTIINPTGVAFGFQRNNQIQKNITEEDVIMNENIENEEPTFSYSTQKDTNNKPTKRNDNPENADISHLKTKSFEYLIQSDELLQEPSCSNTTKKATSKKTPKNDLLEEQLRVQTALYTDVKSCLAGIERYQRKHYKLEEEKLKLYKEDLKRKNEKFKLYKEELKNKKEHRKEMLKIRKEEIEIEKRRIELDEFMNSFRR